MSVSLEPRNLEFLYHNMVRKYPLSPTATAVDTSGAFRIPDDMLAGMTIQFGSSETVADPMSFYISSVLHHATGCLIRLAYEGVGDIAVTWVDLSGGIGKAYPWTPLPTASRFSDVRGSVISGTMNGLSSQPQGSFLFSSLAGAVDPTIPREQPIALREIYVRNASDLQGPFYGRIVFAAGDNTELNVSGSAEGGTTISIKALDTSGFVYGDSGTLGAVPVRTINGVAPDVDGNFTFTPVSDCISISPRASDHALEFDETCSDPCCGCEELKPIADQIKTQNQRIVTLESLIQRAEQILDRVNDAAMSGSKAGCSACS